MMSFGAPKYGRTLKIVLSQPGLKNIVLVDWQGGQDRSETGSFFCTGTLTRHSEPSPQTATVTVKGLSKETRATIIRLHREAEMQSFTDRKALRSGKLEIYAGYGDDAGLLFVGDLAPKGVSETPLNPGHSLTLTAQDGRIEWESRFVRKSVGPGVDLRTIRGVLAAASDYASGKDADRAFEQQFPELIKRREGPAAKEGGFVMFGPAQKVNRALCRDLGIRPFFVDGQVRYIPADEASLTTALVLRRGGENATLLSVSPEELGYYTARCHLDHRLRAGLQVHLREQDDKPIGAGTFRLENAQIRFSNESTPFDATLALRPSVKVEQQL